MKEDNGPKITSCLMLAANLQTPVSLSSVFESGDLKDTGIEYDSHITILYAANKNLDIDDVRRSIRNISGNVFNKLLDEKDEVEYSAPVLDLFELGNFENDSGYVVLKMKPECEWFNILSTLNSGLMKEFNITSDFSNYIPHLTLAELEPGITEKYLNNKSLKLILGGSMIHFEDLIISYSKEGEKEYDVHNITTHHAVDRFFRIRELRKEAIE